MKKYLGPRYSAECVGKDYSLLFTVFWNMLLLFVCVLTGRWYLYLVLWVYPILGVAVTLNSLRSIGEHQPIGFEGIASTKQCITPIIRTTRPGPVEKWLIFQANFNYHFEHHLYPTVPATKLPEVHRCLRENGFYRKHPELLQNSAIAKVLELSRGNPSQGRNW